MSYRNTMITLRVEYDGLDVTNTPHELNKLSDVARGVANAVQRLGNIVDTFGYAGVRLTMDKAGTTVTFLRDREPPNKGST